MAQTYVLRSQKNVDDSDATLAFRLLASTGTDKTIGYCLTKKWKVVPKFDIETSYKPCLVITNMSDTTNVLNIRNFIKNFNISTLNVAGHRDEVVTDFSKKITDLLIQALGK